MVRLPGSVGPSQIFGAWVSEDLTDQSDLEVRESRYLDWTKPPGEAAGRTGPFIRDISLIRLAASSEDIATAEALLRAAGFEIETSGDVLSARDLDTTIELHATTGGTIGMQQVEFTLAADAPTEHVEVIGRSRLTVGPGDRAVWDFSAQDSRGG